jgi:hypothetical protein
VPPFNLGSSQSRFRADMALAAAEAAAGGSLRARRESPAPPTSAGARGRKCGARDLNFVAGTVDELPRDGAPEDSDRE